MAMRTTNGGLQHASSLGNIASSKSLMNFRSYDSEDDSMGRIRSVHSLPRTSVYSKGDIREQYCLSDRQLNSIEPPRRERFFGCLSGRSAQQSFLGVCVGRRAPSDENLTDYAPVYKYPRYPPPGSTSDDFSREDDTENSYFRRKPTSFGNNNNVGSRPGGALARSGSGGMIPDPTIDPKRYTWLSAADDEDSVRLEGPRSICPDINVVGPYIVGSPAYPTKPSNQQQNFLSQSSEHLNGSAYRCPTHKITGVPNNVVPKTPLNNDGAAMSTNNDPTPVSRIKHVSFARSHTLTSFDDASATRHVHYGHSPQSQQLPQPVPLYQHVPLANHPQQQSQPATPSIVAPIVNRSQFNRLGTPTRTHERLIGGKKATLTIQPTNSAQFILQQTSLQMPSFGHSSVGQHQPDLFIVEKAKRNVMKTQATQTQTDEQNKHNQASTPNPLMLSPRTAQRLKSMTLPAADHPLFGRKLTKSLSEAANRDIYLLNHFKANGLPMDHDHLYRTFSEDQPRSPFSAHASRTPSRQSNFTETSRSNTTHSRNPSAESGTSFRSSDYSSRDSVISFKPSAQILDDFEQMEGNGKPYYDTHSLPRKSCIHHRSAEQPHTHSLPRNSPWCSHKPICKHVQTSTAINISAEYLNQMDMEEPESPVAQPNSNHYRRRMSYSVLNPNSATTGESKLLPRRNSVHQSSYQRPTFGDLTWSGFGPSRAEEEQEIFIDFKPRLSPPSPKGRKRGLLKTRSEGEILNERRKDIIAVADVLCPTSQSEEDLLKCNSKLELDEDRFRYQYVPIKDEGIFIEQNFYACANQSNSLGLDILRDNIRKRSISLEEQQHSEGSLSLADSREDVCTKLVFASTDSLPRDVSKEISQSEVVNKATQLSSSKPSSPIEQNQKKLLMITSQEKSSAGLEILNLAECDLKPLLTLSTTVRPIQTPAISITPTSRLTDLSTGAQNPLQPRQIKSTDHGDSTRSAMNSARRTNSSTQVVFHHQSRNMGSTSNYADVSEGSTNTDDYITCTENSKRTSQGTKSRAPKSTVTTAQVTASAASYRSEVATVDGSSFESASSIYGMPTNLESSLAAKASAAAGTSSSVDEGGELYSVGAGKTQNRFPLQSQSSSRSSSASSSDTFNNNNINLPLPPPPPLPLQSNTMTSSSVLSMNIGTSKEQPIRMKGSPSRTNVVTPIMAKQVAMWASVSEDEEAISTSAAADRFTSGKIDWNEEERRCRKDNLKLDFDIEPKDSVRAGARIVKSMASPKTKISTTFKKISPDDRTALNILDGASPSKTKRFRPKTRRSPRNRSSSGGDDLETTAARRLKTNLSKSPTISVAAIGANPPVATVSSSSAAPLLNAPNTENAVHAIASKMDIPKYHPQSVHNQPVVSRRVGTVTTTSMHLGSSKCQKKSGCGTSTDLKVKAISTESLRSVSPGSDSVFYSEMDLALEHQVQCHHCGKEVDIVTAGPDSIETPMQPGEADRPEIEIVQPPAGFADSPNGVTTPMRLYKKVDKRFRSEERHGDRRHRRNRSDTRAKSEERGKNENVPRVGNSGIRPAGSSPCVGDESTVSVLDKFGQQTADPEQGIYHGLYRLGVWICIANQDVFQRPDTDSERPHELSDRRGSTDSEKDFRKKYQALTHRLVHRRSCIEMYKRQSGNTFNFSAFDNDEEARTRTVRGRLQEIVRLMCMVWTKQGLANHLVSGGKKNATDKTVVVSRESGEFGFRIHGSKPVVVSAIEPDTPAESSGLEVGDIVLSVNGTSVIDKSHSEVVKIAHAGSDTLKLEVARTIDIMHPNTYDNTALYSGYLWRPCGYASSNPITSRKWVRRWFTLRPDHCLYFYKSEHESQPVGAILLTNHTVERCGSDMAKPFAFKIDDNENPILYLAGDSDEATNRWVAIMSHAAKQMDPWLELSTKNLRLAPGDVPRPDCFGYLMKLGNRWRSWSRRYCILKDACLYFYQDGKSQNAFGMTCLQGYRVQPSNNYSGKKFAFEISPPEPKLRHYYFATESEMDKKRWIVALEYSIDRWMKAG